MTVEYKKSIVLLSHHDPNDYAIPDNVRLSSDRDNLKRMWA